VNLLLGELVTYFSLSTNVVLGVSFVCLKLKNTLKGKMFDDVETVEHSALE
jgi:hypothetical protein